MPEPAVSHGTLHGGMPYLRLGTGPPLLFLPGITPHHREPRGVDRRFQLQQLRYLAARRQVWWVNRRPGLPAHVTMEELARDYADSVHLVRFGEPIDVVEVSTGGSVALQLAADHPGLVRRLVVVSAACRLGPHGRTAQRRAAESLRAGRPRRAAASLVGTSGIGPLSGVVLGGVGWALGRAVVGDGDPDLLAMLEAEDGFDLEPRLGEITAPTLVVGGERDRFYGRDLLARTAARIPGGTLKVYPRTGHLTTTRRDAAEAALGFLGADARAGDE
ncbi:alpha/beta fold hydrolase [Prauserella oleivorans]|uniref:Alpha/beta fold hydrolase n=1 Tax=Prauserella oleivorans TaxID=1478153 RepID=A0ABW5WAS4_9PSEU